MFCTIFKRLKQTCIRSLTERNFTKSYILFQLRNHPVIDVTNLHTDEDVHLNDVFQYTYSIFQLIMHTISLLWFFIPKRQSWIEKDLENCNYRAYNLVWNYTSFGEQYTLALYMLSFLYCLKTSGVSCFHSFYVEHQPSIVHDGFFDQRYHHWKSDPKRPEGSVFSSTETFLVFKRIQILQR